MLLKTGWMRHISASLCNTKQLSSLAVIGTVRGLGTTQKLNQVTDRDNTPEPPQGAHDDKYDTNENFLHALEERQQNKYNIVSRCHLMTVILLPLGQILQDGTAKQRKTMSRLLSLWLVIQVRLSTVGRRDAQKRVPCSHPGVLCQLLPDQQY